MEPLLGSIILFAGNFAPKGWALCDGRLLSIAQNSALFSILGTTYGGDGRSTFALPDLRGRAPIGPGQGPGLSNVQLGESGGSASVTLTPQEIPAHIHQVQGVLEGLSGTDVPVVQLTQNAAPGELRATPQTVTASGGNAPHNNMSPYLGLNYIIATEGIYPSRP